MIKNIGKKINKKSMIVVLVLFLFCINSVMGFADNLSKRGKEIEKGVKDVMSSAEFNKITEQKPEFVNRIEKFIGDLLEKIGRVLNKLFARTPGFGAAKAPKKHQYNTDIMKIILICVTIIILAIIAVLVIRIIKKRSAKTKKEDDSELLVSMLKKSDKAEKEALELYNKGNYREAIRYLYISLLLKFSDKNIIKINDSKTNRQYLWEIKQSKNNIYNNTVEFTRVFDYFWYGINQPKKEDFDYWYEEYQVILRGEA